MIDNCDFGVIINKEMDSNENMYMGFKVIKTRTKCDLELMYQPYVPENPVKLVEDIELVAPAFRRSLKDENQPISRVSRRNDFNNMSQGSKHAVDDDELFGAVNDVLTYLIQGKSKAARKRNERLGFISTLHTFG